MEKKKGGRPRKPEGTKLEQFSIRLPPDLKFGLELLARHQGRSLSQAMEWALQHALSNVQIGDVSLWRIVAIAYHEAGWMRAYTLYGYDQTLVPFEERHACRLVDASPEVRAVREFLNDSQKSPQERWELKLKWFRLIDRFWHLLTEDSGRLDLDSSGRVPLLLQLGVARAGYTDMIAMIERAYADLTGNREQAPAEPS